MKRYLVASSCALLLLLGLQSLPASAANAEAPDWVLIGQGSYSRLFLPIYDARLEARQPRFHFPDTTPYALSFVYKRDIDAEDLVDNVLAEWKKQKLVWPTAWESALQRYLPAVHAGDSFRLEINTDNSAVFLYNGNAVITFTDPEFVNAFIGIWLGENTDNSKLRLQLLGLRK